MGGSRTARSHRPALHGRGVRPAPRSNDLGAAETARLATALAVALWRQREPALGSRPSSWEPTESGRSAELRRGGLPALVLAGCRAIETGALTPVSLAARRLVRSATPRCGSATPRVSRMRSRCRLGARPLGPGRRRADWTRCANSTSSNPAGPSAAAADSSRAAADDAYLAPLVPLFHGLRPLRLLLDTRVKPLFRYCAGWPIQPPAKCWSPTFGAGRDALAVAPTRSRLTMDRRLAASRPRRGRAAGPLRPVDRRRRRVVPPGRRARPGVAGERLCRCWPAGY